MWSERDLFISPKCKSIRFQTRISNYKWVFIKFKVNHFETNDLSKRRGLTLTQL